MVTEVGKGSLEFLKWGARRTLTLKKKESVAMKGKKRKEKKKGLQNPHNSKKKRRGFLNPIGTQGEGENHRNATRKKPVKSSINVLRKKTVRDKNNENEGIQEKEAHRTQ